MKTSGKVNKGNEPIVVAVIGEGVLAQLVGEELSGQYEVIKQANLKPGAPQGSQLILLLHDDEDAWQGSDDILQLGDTPWLSAMVSVDEGWIGPLAKPGLPGCTSCAEYRRRLAGHDSEEKLEQLMNRLLMPEDYVRKTYASVTGLGQMALLIAAETRKFVNGGTAVTENSLCLIDLKTLQTSLHPFLPNPLCPSCSRLPDDSPDAARIRLQPRLKVHPASLRCRPKEDLIAVLAKQYVDERTGQFNSSIDDLVSPFASTVVQLPLDTGGDELTGGRAHTLADSRMTAILEGLERYCAYNPRGKRTVVHGSYRSLAEQALDPVQAGVYSQQQYAQSDFPFAPFDPDQSIPWVWGYSFLQARPLLIPERLAYYSLVGGDGFVNETSNGCAVGCSLEEAILHGILEVVERDSFLMTWYGSLPVPRLDLRTAKDLELNLMIERLLAVTGYELHVFNMTMEHGIPAIWAVAKNTREHGMNLLSGAGAHLDPIRAIKSAIHELAGMLPALGETFREEQARAEEMLRDPFEVREMADHSLLYGLPEAEGRLAFLLENNRPPEPISESFRPAMLSADLTMDLKAVLRKLHRLGLDVIVVDQTPCDMRRNGLYGVKVLIPGMLPMTFGHHLTRLTGLERVLTVPEKLGYAREPLTAAQLNPYPHPFP
ncbi:TOMM precursor leader peptide-binding protein [Paenibacillus puerhi]|uniref:TOMM precursor leader peptide-binding protein n=1 Tax=Paenibacillus puerhi TaxID=2692622 RepID=UPI001358BD5D|nr:TOMM precursor leader peptide-binding protein [Paenibacillus puerhi]